MAPDPALASMRKIATRADVYPPAEDSFLLVDALALNGSLTHLDLSKSELVWDERQEADGKVVGIALLERMARDGTALSGLKTLIASSSGFSIPVGDVRAGGEARRAALRGMAFLSKDGPWVEDVGVVATLVRDEMASIDAAIAMLGECLNGKQTVASWRTGLAELMADGAGVGGAAAEAAGDVGTDAAEVAPGASHDSNEAVVGGAAQTPTRDSL